MEEPVASRHTLEVAGNIIGLAATACLFLSVLYDWGSSTRSIFHLGKRLPLSQIMSEARLSGYLKLS